MNLGPGRGSSSVLTSVIARIRKFESVLELAEAVQVENPYLLGNVTRLKVVLPCS